MLLSGKNIQAAYGSAQALFGVDIEIGEGQVVALMGRNGMGKSTTIKCLCAMLKPFAGDITFAGHDMTKLPLHKAAQAGLGLVPEGRRCFPNLTVLENLVATERPGQWGLNNIHALFPRLKERSHQYADSLSGGEQQMLAIGRALMTNPKLLILDEATEGLAPVIRKEIWNSIRLLKQQSQSILIVDKTLKELLPVADHCVILEKGQTVWTGLPSALNDDLKKRYLGV